MGDETLYFDDYGVGSNLDAGDTLRDIDPSVLYFDDYGVGSNMWNPDEVYHTSDGSVYFPDGSYITPDGQVRQIGEVYGDTGGVGGAVGLPDGSTGGSGGSTGDSVLDRILGGLGKVGTNLLDRFADNPADLLKLIAAGVLAKKSYDEARSTNQAMDPVNMLKNAQGALNQVGGLQLSLPQGMQTPGYVPIQRPQMPNYAQPQRPQMFSEGGEVDSGPEYWRDRNPSPLGFIKYLLAGGKLPSEVEYAARRKLLGLQRELEPKPAKPVDVWGGDALKRREAEAGLNSNYKRGGLAAGSTGGQDDKVPALLSDGEYVFDAETVSALGDGNTNAGAAKLDKMRQNIRQHKRNAPTAKIAPKAKAPGQYLKGK